MVRIMSALVPLIAVMLHALLKGSMQAARRGDVLCGQDITFRGGPGELLLEMWILIKSRDWNKVKRGSWHALSLIWISLLPFLLLQFGSWNREMCSSTVHIIDTESGNSSDWFNSTKFTEEQKARVALTFRHNLALGMSTNTTGTLSLKSDGAPISISSPVVYSFRQCLYWTGELYDGCESSQGIRESFNSTVMVTPDTWNTTDRTNTSWKRSDLPYVEEIEFYEYQQAGADSSIKCLTTTETKAWVCTFKSGNAWCIADIFAGGPKADGFLVDVPMLRLEGLNKDDGEWVWYATVVAAEINGGGYTINTVKDVGQMAMVFARFDYLLQGVKQTCRFVRKESFVVSYIWIGVLAITAVLSVILVWSIFKQRSSVHVPMRGFEWYTYGARMYSSVGEEEGSESVCGKRPDIYFYHKKFGLSKGDGNLQHLTWNEDVYRNQGERIIGIGCGDTPENQNVQQEQDVELLGCGQSEWTRTQ